MPFFHLSPSVYKALIKVARPARSRRARSLRRVARAALKAKEFEKASELALDALRCDPTLRGGAVLLAQAMAGARNDSVQPSWLAEQSTATDALAHGLSGWRLVSNPMLEALAVLKVLNDDVLGALDALDVLRGEGAEAALSSELLKLLVPRLVGRAALHRLFGLMDRLGIPANAPMRERVVKLWLFEEMTFGVTHQGPHPLLDPEVFAAFTQTVETRRSAFAALPDGLQDSIRVGQAAALPSLARRSGRRLLVVADNWNFFPLAARALEASDFEIRYLDCSLLKSTFREADPDLSFPRQTRSIVARPAPDLVWAALVRDNRLASDLIEWADAVFCEWFTDAAIWMSRYLPQDKTLIARIHSYEAFTYYPFLANMSRFDGLVFIAPQIRNVFRALLGKELTPDCPMAVIPNFRDTSGFRRAVRDPAARRTLGMTQYASANKDPMFALDVLAALQSNDPTWRLRLVGSPWEEGKDALYRNAFEERAAGFGESVVIDGFTRNMQGWYGQIGYILSTSQREGSHESLVEGMLTGAVPVLRDWPMVAPFGAPAEVFPGLPRFATPEAASAEVRATAVRFDAASDEAERYAKALIAEPDPAVEMPCFLRFVMDGHAVRAGKPLL